MPKISSLQARQIYDSSATPTIETKVLLDDGSEAISSAPTGISKGKHEAFELRDNDPKKNNGQSVYKAIDNINNIISKAIVNLDAQDQTSIDRAMIDLDGTQNKSNLGANAILSVSQAVAKAAAISAKIPLYEYLAQYTSDSKNEKNMPVPMFNLIEGGTHARNVLNFEEFLVIPASSKTFNESLDIGLSVYHALLSILIDRGMKIQNSTEGGFCPDVSSNQSALAFLKNAIDQSGLTFSLDVFMGIGVSASSVWDGKNYKLIDRSTPYDSGDLVAFYQDLFNEFGLIYMGDPFADDDFDGWKKIKTLLGEKTLIVGDDIVCTNPFRLNLAIENNLLEAVVIKPNQIGTVTEAIAVAEIAKYKELKIIVATRNAETDDTFISDFAVGIRADYVKFGAPSRERIIQYNHLLKVEKDFTK